MGVNLDLVQKVSKIRSEGGAREDVRRQPDSFRDAHPLTAMGDQGRRGNMPEWVFGAEWWVW